MRVPVNDIYIVEVAGRVWRAYVNLANARREAERVQKECRARFGPVRVEVTLLHLEDGR